MFRGAGAGGPSREIRFAARAPSFLRLQPVYCSVARIRRGRARAPAPGSFLAIDELKYEGLRGPGHLDSAHAINEETLDGRVNTGSRSPGPFFWKRLNQLMRPAGSCQGSFTETRLDCRSHPFVSPNTPLRNSVEIRERVNSSKRYSQIQPKDCSQASQQPKR